MVELTGGCLCGAVRYRARGAAVRSYLCHCRDCQRATGSAFAAAMLFAKAAVTVEGELARFVATADSGAVVQRHFCPRCGSGVINTGAEGGAFLVVMAGTLDEPAAFRPMAEIFCRVAMVEVSGERRRCDASWG